MEPLPAETLTILATVAIVLAGLAFVTISIRIIYLFYIEYRSPNNNNAKDTHRKGPSTSHNNQLSLVSNSLSFVSSTVTSVKTKSSAVRPIKEVPPSPQIEYHPNTIDATTEHCSNSQNEQQYVYRHDNEDNTTLKTESEISQYDQQRQQWKESFEPIFNVRFLNRKTPYPAEILAREQLLISHHRYLRHS